MGLNSITRVSRLIMDGGEGLSLFDECFFAVMVAGHKIRHICCEERVEEDGCFVCGF